MKRLVIDTDPGLDDAHAIMMACAHPDVRVEAITTVGGNVGLQHTTQNACLILDIMDASTPVYAGAAGPLLQRMTEDASTVHGGDGLGNSGYSPSCRAVEHMHGVNALSALATAAPEQLTLVTIGPLTNVALATRLDPELPYKYAGLIVMGGAIRSMGNTSNPSAEFNIYADPEAAAIVFESWPSLQLVSWETTIDHGLPIEQWLSLFDTGTRRSEFLQRIMANHTKQVREVRGLDKMYSADPLAMAVALEPGIVRCSERRFVQVELAGGHTRGQTTVDWTSRTGHAPNADIVLEVDQERLWSLLRSAVV